MTNSSDTQHSDGGSVSDTTANVTAGHSPTKDENPDTTTSPEQEQKQDLDKHHFDLSSIRSLIEKDIGQLFNVSKNDVDWFLRDSNIPTKSKPSQPSQPSSSHSNHSNITPVSLHINTAISNTNENNTSKTKPSILPIQEEPVAHSISSPPQASRRRSSVSSIGSIGSASSNGSNLGGFFSKLKDKFKKESAPSSPVQAPQPHLNPFKENYDLSLKKTPSPSDAPLRRSLSNSSNRLTKSISTPCVPDPKAAFPSDNLALNSDPYRDAKLNEYVKFYQRHELRPSSRRLSVASLAHDISLIPEHPEKSPLPSVLKNGFDNVTYNSTDSTDQVGPSTSSKFGSFLRRRSSTVPSLSPAPSLPNAPAVPAGTGAVSSDRFSDSPATSISPDPPAPATLPEFKDLKPLRRVAFHSLTFLIDPPQQIPSRSPRKGNVEVLPNGSLKICPLSEADKKAIERSQMGKGGGIVVGGTGPLRLIKKNPDEQENQETTENEDDEKIDKHAKLIAIDKPIVNQNYSYSVPVKKMALDLMYTRCCHLREILPIPAILKQIPKGSMAPLPQLQLRNPDPTMVEIQTFSDFIRIAPILCVCLDGVSLSLEQWKILLSAMSAKKQLEKLSLRNTPIDRDGWSLLCWFLSRNKVLTKLDITQCPSLSVNLLKKKKRPSDQKRKQEENLVRMSCNKENRSDMDWSLFTATIIARGGIDELLLTGCCINDFEVFEKLIKHAVLIKTSRLGLAYNQLSVRQIKVVQEHWLLLDFARGLDLGYNDLLSVNYMISFLELQKLPEFEAKMANSPLSFLSLNATNTRFSEQFREVFETMILRFPNLRYLDLSNNPRLFGTVPTSKESSEMKESASEASINSESTESLHTQTYTQETIVSFFTSKFPLFPKLIRLHLDNNNFSSQSLVSIANILPFCKNLGYFSVIGNKLDLIAGAALTQALKNSRTLITLDADYEDFPEFFKERIGLYSMRNMEKLFNSTQDVKQDEASSLTEQLNDLLHMSAEQKLDLKSPKVVQVVEKARNIRKQLKDTMGELLKLQWANKLNMEGKETLIRFLFIDSSIEKGLQLLHSSLVDKEEHPQQPSSMFFLGSSEDETNKYRVTSEAMQSEDTSNSNLTISEAEHISTSASPMSLSRSQSKTSLTNLNRQEGSVLKLSKLTDFHGQPPLLDDSEGLSGEEIRKKLMSVDFLDLDKIIGFLNTLKDKGITLRQFYVNGEGNNDVDFIKDTERLNLSELKERIMKVAEQHSKSQGKEKPTVARSTSEEHTFSEAPLGMEPEVDVDISQQNGSSGESVKNAYDEVLRELFKAQK